MVDDEIDSFLNCYFIKKLKLLWSEKLELLELLFQKFGVGTWFGQNTYEKITLKTSVAITNLHCCS
jgi:hypothetical protein